MESAVSVDADEMARVVDGLKASPTIRSFAFAVDEGSITFEEQSIFEGVLSQKVVAVAQVVAFIGNGFKGEGLGLTSESSNSLPFSRDFIYLDLFRVFTFHTMLLLSLTYDELFLVLHFFVF